MKLTKEEFIILWNIEEGNSDTHLLKTFTRYDHKTILKIMEKLEKSSLIKITKKFDKTYNEEFWDAKTTEKAKTIYNEYEKWITKLTGDFKYGTKKEIGQDGNKPLEEIKTADGSITFHNSEYDSAYHSLTGAEEEAVKKYAEQSGLAELAKEEHSIRILDICFGLGYNSAAAIDAINDVDPNCSINVLGIDNDEKIIAKIQEVNAKFLSYGLFKKLSRNKISHNQHWVKEKNSQIVLFISDARIILKELAKEKNPALKFDAVFLDPFSPKKCPELWTEEFFKDIKAVMKRKAILITYSCARNVRDNLKKAGFQVKDGQNVGRRGPSTIAIS